MALRRQNHPGERPAIALPVLALILALGAATPAVEFSGGTGEPNDPYQIATAEQLIAIGSDLALLDKSFILVCDIDLDPGLPGGRTFQRAVVAPHRPEYRYEFRGRPFEGSFDGRGRVIRNLTIADPCACFLGLFGGIGAHGRVSNLMLQDATIQGDMSVAGLAGLNRGWIEGCTVVCAIQANGPAGTVAATNEGTIVASSSRASVRAKWDAGGLVGDNDGTLRMCCSRGQVSGGSNVGGLAADDDGDIISCYSTADVEGKSGGFTGGLVGYGPGGSSAFGRGSIVTSYAAGKVRGGRSGGLVAVWGNVYLSYWDRQITGQSSSYSGKGKTTAQMKSPETFRGWGSDGAWVLDAGKDYPRLAWEDLPGEPIVNLPDRYAGGTGEPNDPYRIDTPEQFCNIAWHREDFDKCFVLTADIDMNDVDRTAILPIGVNGVPFLGIFDGQRHVISNFRYAAQDDYIGLFGAVGKLEGPRVASKGIVRNLTVENADVTGLKLVGGLAGANAGVIESCGVSGRVKGDLDVGGLVGAHVLEGSGAILRSYSTCEVEGKYHYVGGLVGSSGRDSSGAVTPCGILSCYSTGSVKGTSSVGGLVGMNYGMIATCYSTSPVTGDLETNPPSVGGLVGMNSGRSHLSYWDVETSKLSISAGGKGKTKAQMMDASTYRGWGAAGDWTIQDGNDYPRLAWQGKPGQPVVEAEHGYSGGTGNPNDPYRIRTAEDLIALAYHQDDWGRHFVVTADIDLTGVDPNVLLPIGHAALPFSGVFNGDSHTIRGFRCLMAGESYVGLFGCVDPNGPDGDGSGGRITSLHLLDTDVAGSHCVAMLAGANRGIIEGCRVEGTVRGRGQDIGGLAGANEDVVSGGYVIGYVTGGWAVGGVVGVNAGRIEACGFDGIMATNGDSVGGVVGRNGGRIEACCSRGSVSGQERIGGVAGDDYGTLICCYSRCSVMGTKEYIGGLAGAGWYDVAYCYSIGRVSGAGYVGGLVGASMDRAFNSYWDTTSSAMTTSWTGRGRTTGEMMKAQTYRGWGHPGVWVIDEGRDYPRLAWEGSAGVPIVDAENRYSAGTGEPNAPYEIRTAADFAGIAYYQQDFDKHFVLVNDVDLREVNAEEFAPIGTRRIPFTGFFDGCGHAISHFTYAAESEDYAGLFGGIAKAGVVRNLGIVGADIRTGNSGGAIVGFNGGTIASCYAADGIITATWANAGGLAGYNEGLLTSCWSSNSVSSPWNAGGLAGYSSGTIESCYSTGMIQGKDCAGGLVGANAGPVVRCYSAARVSGDTNTGGILGGSFSYEQIIGEISSSFWDVEVCGPADGIGNLHPEPDGAFGRTTQEMQTAAMFIAAGWDFEDVWTICEGKSYPRLRWEGMECGAGN